MTIEGAGEVPSLATLIEYDPPNKLAYESAMPTDDSVKMQVRVEFVEVEDGTLVRLVHSGIPNIKVDGDMELRKIVQEGWTAAFGKLSDFMGQLAT